MREVMVSERYAGADLLVLLAIALHADHDGGSAYPGNNRIAALVGCNLSTVHRVCRRLQGDGVLRKIAESRGRGHATYWKVNRDALRKGPRPPAERGSTKSMRPAKGMRGARLSESERYAWTPGKVCMDDAKGMHGARPQYQDKSDSSPPPSLAATAAAADEKADWSLTAETSLTLSLREVNGRRHKSTLANANEARRFLETAAGLLAKKEYESPDWRALGNSPWDRTFRLLDLWEEANRVELNLPPRTEGTAP